MVSPLKIRDNSIEGPRVVLSLVILLVDILDRFITGAVEKNTLSCFRKPAERRAQFEFEMLCQTFKHLVKVDGVSFFPRPNCSLAYRKRGIRHHKVWVDHHLCSQPVTLGACALRIIKRKQAWFQLWIADVAVAARELLTKQQLFAFCSIFHYRNHELTLCKKEPRFYRVGKTFTHVFLNDQSVYYDFDRVLELFVQCDFLVE